MSELFNVVFSGEISGRADPAVVRANVGKLFNASEPVLDKLFSGQPVAVKKMVDRATAMKVRAMMKQAGAETRLVQVDEQGRPLAAAGATTAAPAQPAPAPAAAAPVARPAPVAPAATPAVANASAPPAAAPKPTAESMAERVKRMAEEQLRQEAEQAAAAKAADAQGNWGVAPAWHPSEPGRCRSASRGAGHFRHRASAFGRCRPQRQRTPARSTSESRHFRH
jgi:hypothetical protein